MRAGGIAVIVGTVLWSAAVDAHAQAPCRVPVLPAAELAQGSEEVRGYRDDRARAFAPDLMGYRDGPRLAPPTVKERRDIEWRAEIRREHGLNDDPLLIRRLVKDPRAIQTGGRFGWVEVTALELRILRFQQRVRMSRGPVEEYLRACTAGSGGSYFAARQTIGGFVGAHVTRGLAETRQALRVRFRYADMVRVRLVPRSYAELDTIVRRLYADRVLRRAGIQLFLATVNVPRNRVDVGLYDPSARARRLLRRRYGEAVLMNRHPVRLYAEED